MEGWWRRACAAVAICVAGTGLAQAVNEADLLPVDQAFVLTAQATSRNRIELHWKIADGYYLYRHRMGVQAADSAFKTNPLDLPHGARHHDEFFGEVETFRGQVTAVQTGAAASGVDRVTLQVKYQGCADVGVCYPPQRRTLTVSLPKAAGDPPRDGSEGIGGLAGLARALGGGSSASPLLGTTADGKAAPLPLPPEQAFGFEAIAGDGNTLLLRFTPAKGYYL
jgi:thiol:disulfide interchange protein DsbD